MSEEAAKNPITEKALARLRALAEGNGIEAKKIELIGTEEKELTLRAEMLLSVDVPSTRTKLKGAAINKTAQVLGSMAELPARVAAMKENLLEAGDWIKEAVDQLKSEPGEGFGIERAEITLDNLVQVFQATQNCEACHGVGSTSCEACKGSGNIPCKICNATGQELCYHCQGTGKNPTAQPQSCPQCHGRGQIPHTVTQNCPQCHGRGNIQRDTQQPCPSCHGSGRDHRDPHAPCHTCAGRGNIHTMAMQNCQACGGRGQVQITQQQTCQQCHGRGSLPPNPQQAICPICNGQMRILCRTCTGKKQVLCTTCSGKGKTACPTCHGDGKYTVEERALPTARCQFRLLDTANVPSGLRRALDRFGFKLLVKSGAKISVGSANKAENKTATMAYGASFPFAELRLRINGKPLLATAVGDKGALRDIPNFFDPVFGEALKKLEKNSGAGALNRAFRLRALRELFELMQEGEGAPQKFRRLYPIGFSATMIERMQALLGRLVEASTFTIRASVAGVMLFVLSAVYFMLIGSGARLHLAKATMPAAAFVLDVFICASSFLIINLALRMAAALKLRSLAKKDTGLHLKAQHAGSLGISTSLCALLIYAGLLWFLKATPGFFG